MITIFKNIFSKEPHYITIDKALERIKLGKSKNQVELIRKALDKERANELKKNLPSVCFSGKFGANRTDQELETHSSYIVLDFDMVTDCSKLKSELAKKEYVKATWVSPSGNGVKCLILISDGKKHRQHFQSLNEIYPEVDKSGINVSRVCYESFDPEIIINDKVKAFTKVKAEKVIETKAIESQNEVFQNILKWLSNRGDAFRTGERNLFLFKLASACCRFGISETDCEYYFNQSFVTSDFSKLETNRCIRSAYKANAGQFATAIFERETLVNKSNSKEIEINDEIYNLDIKPKDVIFGEDVKQEALSIFNQGYESASSTFIPNVDVRFKFKKGEITLISGIGNYGKSTFLKYLLLLQVLHEGKKFALFSPEDNPAAEFYHDLVEICLGTRCTPDNPNRPKQETYEQWYDFISQHIFYVYPKTVAPTPEYIKERFLELIIKEKIDGCIIDPFNQLTNDYAAHGNRSDKYLEFLLSDFARFAQTNQTLFVIVAHPKAMRKDKDSLNYPEPDVFDIADGAMWNNKMDNILMYHRPYHGEDKESPICTLSSKKIRRQKIVGLPGTIEFEYDRRKRRYVFSGIDYIQLAFDKIMSHNKTSIEPNYNFTNDIIINQYNEDQF